MTARLSCIMTHPCKDDAFDTRLALIQKKKEGQEEKTRFRV